MNENAGRQAHADKNKHARSRPTVKMQMQTANSNWNATRSLSVSLKKLQSPHPSHSHLRCFWERNVRTALSVCVFYVVIAFHDTNSNGLCSATHCVASWKAEGNENGGQHTKAEEEDARAYSACACMCVAWVILFSIISFLLFYIYLISLHTKIRTNFICFTHVLVLQNFPRMRNRNTRTKNDDDFRMLLLF